MNRYSVSPITGKPKPVSGDVDEAGRLQRKEGIGSVGATMTERLRQAIIGAPRCMALGDAWARGSREPLVPQFVDLSSASHDERATWRALKNG